VHQLSARSDRLNEAKLQQYLAKHPYLFFIYDAAGISANIMIAALEAFPSQDILGWSFGFLLLLSF
jgi:hypothetical protein